MSQASKPELSVSFHNFWGGFDPASSFFARALGTRFRVKIVGAGRDIQISSVFGGAPLPEVPGQRPLRIWWTGEAQDPQHQTYDLYFGFRPKAGFLGKRWHRLPLWVLYIDWWDENSPRSLTRLTDNRLPAAGPKFCNFIYSAPASIRVDFFRRLGSVRAVDSLGLLLNNAGASPHDEIAKIDLLRSYVLTLAFENQIAPGYVTEKILHPLLSGSIPVYWGDEQARSDFNPDAFVFADDFDNEENLIRRLIAIADSPQAIAEFHAAPPFRNNRVSYENTPDYFLDRVGEALSGPLEPFAAPPYFGSHGENESPWKRLRRKLGLCRAGSGLKKDR